MSPNSLLQDPKSRIKDLNQTVGFRALIQELEESQQRTLSKVVDMAVSDDGEFTDAQVLSSFRAWASKQNMIQSIKRMVD